ncbi:MAG: glycosyltransferase family 4 protein [Nitrospirota bacterium]
MTDATTHPRIIYSCFTKIGASGLGLDALELLKGIHARGALVKGVFYGSRQNEIPKDRLRLIRFHPYHLFSNFSSRYYYPLKRIHLDRVTSSVIRREGCDVFHGWSTESIRSIEAAHEVGAVAFVERASLHPKVSMDLLEEEYDRFGIQRRPVRLNGLLATIDAVSRSLTVGLEEIDRADRVIVQSPYAVETFVAQGVPREKLVVVPRAVDTNRFTPPSTRERDRTFRALFAGQLCLRKGLPYLLRAWTALRLRDAELTLLGPLHDDVKALLAKVTDPSIKHVPWSDDTTSFYRRASVLVLPSLVEGSAKVTYEAMACGVPVIVTPNAGAVARDRQEGFVVPIRDDGAIKEALLALYENRDLVRAYGQAARKTVETYSWDHHRDVMWKAYRHAYEAAH